MHCTHNGSSTPGPSCPQDDAPTPLSTPEKCVAVTTVPPALCAGCQQNVLTWLRQYERELETQARTKRSRNGYLNLALAKHVAHHLRLLRRSLGQPSASIIEIAKEMFEATEINTTGENGSSKNGASVPEREVPGSCD